MHVYIDMRCTTIYMYLCTSCVYAPMCVNYNKCEKNECRNSQNKVELTLIVSE